VNRFTSQPDSSGLNNLVNQQPERFVDANALAEHLGVTRRQVFGDDTARDHSGASAGHWYEPESLALQDQRSGERDCLKHSQTHQRP